MATMQDLRDLGLQMKSVQDRKTALEAELATVNIELDRLRTKAIPEMMAELELRNATFEGLGRVQLASDLYASTKEGQKGAAMQWFRDCGYADVIQETYNASSAKAIFRNIIKEGGEVPDAIFNITPFVRASIVKA